MAQSRTNIKYNTECKGSIGKMVLEHIVMLVVMKVNNDYNIVDQAGLMQLTNLRAFQCCPNPASLPWPSLFHHYCYY